MRARKAEVFVIPAKAGTRPSFGRAINPHHGQVPAFAGMTVMGVYG